MLSPRMSWVQRSADSDLCIASQLALAAYAVPVNCSCKVCVCSVCESSRVVAGSEDAFKDVSSSSHIPFVSALFKIIRLSESPFKAEEEPLHVNSLSSLLTSVGTREVLMDTMLSL